MNKKLRMAAFAAAFAVTLSMTGSYAETTGLSRDEKCVVAIVTASGVINIRKGPGLDQDILCQMDSGAEIIAIGDVDEDGWVKVKANGVDGYAAADYLNITDRVVETGEESQRDSSWEIIEVPSETDSKDVPEESIEEPEIVPEPNLLLNTGVFYTRTGTENSVLTYTYSVDPSVDIQSLIGNVMTVSLYVETPGERAAIQEDSTDVTANRFGGCVVMEWEDSTGVLETVTRFYGTDLLAVATDGDRMFSTFEVQPPEGYDTLADIKGMIQNGSRPATDKVVWIDGYMKLEIGSKATAWLGNENDNIGDIDKYTGASTVA